MLTPLDVQNKDFAKGIRGYSPKDVDEYMAMIARSMEDLINLNIELTSKNKNIQEDLEKYIAIESTLNEALILAQKTAESTVENANEKAKYIIEKSEDNAKQILDNANSELMEITKKYEDAKQEYLKFNIRIKSVMEAQVACIQTAYDKDL